MADKANFSTMSIKVSNKGENFESMFKRFILRSEQEWEENEEEKDKFLSIINNLRYCDKQVHKAYDKKRLLLALYKEGQLVTVSENIILDEVEKIAGVYTLRGFYYIRNKKVLGLQFRSEEARREIEEKLRSILSADVIWLHWFSSVTLTSLRVHWIPEDYCQKELIDFINNYMEIVEMCIEKKDYGNKRYLTKSIVFVKGILKAEFTKESLPHLFLLDGLEGLIVVRDRLPLCLNCEVIGHMAYQCDVRSCKHCKSRVKSGHVCLGEEKTTQSYAEKTAKSINVKALRPFIQKINLESKDEVQELSEDDSIDDQMETENMAEDSNENIAVISQENYNENNECNNKVDFDESKKLIDSNKDNNIFKTAPSKSTEKILKVATDNDDVKKKNSSKKYTPNNLPENTAKTITGVNTRKRFLEAKNISAEKQDSPQKQNRKSKSEEKASSKNVNKVKRNLKSSLAGNETPVLETRSTDESKNSVSQH